MGENQIFALTLGLTPLEFKKNVSFDFVQMRPDLFLDFKLRSKFLCPECGGGDSCPVLDTTEKTCMIKLASKKRKYFQVRLSLA